MDAYTDTHTHKIKEKMLGKEKHGRKTREIKKKKVEREDKILLFFSRVSLHLALLK